MAGGDRDWRAYLPGFATIVVLAAVLALAPSVIPRPVREAIGLAPSRLEPERRVGNQGSFAFLSHQPGRTDEPVGYDPCKPIKVRINPEDAPEGYRGLVEYAMAEVGDLAGLRFTFDGTTDERPRWERANVPVFLGEPRTRPVLVSWADEDEVPQLAGPVAGIGGSVAVIAGSGKARYVTGGVTLDEDVFAVLAADESGRFQARAIVLHEFGHLVGLAHVDDEGELMHQENVGLLDFGPGDVAGLARVGATPCS